MEKVNRLRRGVATARVLLGTLVGAGLVVASATPATAHVALEASTPKEGAQVKEPLDQITLDFTGPIRAGLARITLRGPDGERFESGKAQVVSDVVTQSLKQLTVAGEYEIVYRIVAADGHLLSEKIRFTLAPSALPRSDETTGDTSQQPLRDLTPAFPRLVPGNGSAAAVAAPDVPEEEVPPWMLGLAAAGAAALVTGTVLFGRRVSRDLD